MSTLTYLLSFAATFLIILQLSATIYTIIYQKYLYPKRFRSKYNLKYQPGVSVIVPIKNIPVNFDKNFKSLLGQDYPNYEVIFSVESKDDPAYKYIKSQIKKYSQLKLAVSSIATRCVQKNQNIITALKLTNNSEVYIFADDDSALNDQWLRELIIPLSDPQVTATSTYFWPYSPNSTLPEMMHVYMNIYTYTLYCFASSFLGSTLLWGGSIAIRKKVFNELKVKEYWSTSMSDDTQLSKLLSDHRHKTVFVSTALSKNNTPIENIGETINWYVRQLMYIKICRKKIWYLTTNVIFWFLISIYFWALISTPLYLFLPNSDYVALVAIPIVFFILDALISTLFIFLGPINNPAKFIVLTPILRIGQLIAYIKTFFCSKFSWCGIDYQFDSRGKVTNIKR